MRKLIDLSHTIEDGMITYKGLPAPIVCDYLSREASTAHYAEGTTFQIGRVDMVGCTGTYIDAPFHRYVDGKDLAELPLEAVAYLEGVVIRVPDGTRRIGPQHLRDARVRDRAVLVHSGWSQHWRSDRYFEGHPHLTEDAARWLRDAGCRLVGIDSLNIDDTSTGARPVHSLLLGAEIPIVEHLCNLELLPDAPFRLHTVPVKVRGCGTFPVRAYASVTAA